MNKLGFIPTDQKEYRVYKSYRVSKNDEFFKKINELFVNYYYTSTNLYIKKTNINYVDNITHL